MKIIKLLALLVVSSIVLSSCSKDKPEVVNEEEVITTLIVTLENGEEKVILKSFDSDGEGSKKPVLTVSGNLKKGVTYNGSIKLLNETENPVENITEEVQEEADEHQFFYKATNGVATFAYKDVDGDSNPIGLKFTLTTSADAKKGKVTFILKHEPNKKAAGVKEGDITKAGGSTDVEVTFDVDVI